MRYVLKKSAKAIPWGGKYTIVCSKERWEYSENISSATMFSSIPDALKAVTDMARSSTSYSFGDNFTIVGVEEVSTPQYKEVIL